MGLEENKDTNLTEVEETNNLVEENVASETPSGNQENVEGSQPSEVNVEPVQTEPEDAEIKSEEGENATPKQTKEENSFFKHMRERAEKEAEAKTKKQIEDFKAKIQKCLPDGYTDVDEYLNNIGDSSEEEEVEETEDVEETPTAIPQIKQEQPTFDDKKIEELVAKKLESIPELQEIKIAKEKEKEDKFIISSFEELRAKFPQIKTPNDVPIGVWELWQVGKSGRSLVSCMKEHSYDYDIKKAKEKGAAVAKSQINSVAHTGVINGGSNTNVKIEEEVSVPPETQKMLAMTGIPKSKWVEYYKKYHKY